MNELSKELIALEQNLADVLPADPPAALRERVLRSALDMKSIQKNDTQARRRFIFGAVIAATVLVWMNMSLFVSGSIDLEDRSATKILLSPETERQLAMLDELVSEIGTDPSHSMSILWLTRRQTSDLPDRTLIRNLSPM